MIYEEMGTGPGWAQSHCGTGSYISNKPVREKHLIFVLEGIPGQGLFAWLWKMCLRRTLGRGVAKKSMFWGRREPADTSICPAGQAVVPWAIILLQGWEKQCLSPKRTQKDAGDTQTHIKCGMWFQAWSWQERGAQIWPVLVISAFGEGKC